MERIRPFDGLRALAFLAVFCNHAIPIPMLWVGVDLFFVLSGFLITSILLRSRRDQFWPYLREFYSRRARRILPAYFLLLTLVTLVFRFDWSGKWYFYAFFVQNFAVAFKGPQGVLNPLWSLGVEEQFYLIWPLLVYLLDRRFLVKALFVMLLAAPLLRAFFTPIVADYEAIFCLTPFRMDLLAAGSLIAVYWSLDRERVMSWNRAAGYMALLSGIVFVVLAAMVPDFRAKSNALFFNTFGYTLSTICFVSVLVYTLTLRKGFVYSALGSTGLVYLGTISYMMYMAHEPFLALFNGTASLSRALMALAATIVFSSITWKLIEKPLLGRRTSAVAGPARSHVTVATQAT